MGFMDFLSGLGSGAQLRKLQKVADQVNSIEEEFQAMSDAELRAETDNFRKRIEDGCGNLYVLVNYTALFGTRNILKKLEGEK